MSDIPIPVEGIVCGSLASLIAGFLLSELRASLSRRRKRAKSQLPPRLSFRQWRRERDG